MSEIKKPVIYDTEAWYIEDADGNVVCDIDAEGLLSDEFHFIGNEIATAINEHADLKAKLASQREFLKYVAGQSKEALAIIQREGFVFDHSGGRWEKLAFTLYSDLVAISTDARHRLEEIEEVDDERWKV